jgi:hypothetical protein
MDHYLRHHRKENAHIPVSQTSTSKMNPGIDPEIIALAYGDGPESVAIKYSAEVGTVVPITDF